MLRERGYPEWFVHAVLSHGDHRVAMSFAVAGLLARGETTIEGAECADISFPGFFDQLDSLTAAC